MPIYLDGRSSWRTRTEPEHAQVLNQIPVGTEIAVDAVPRFKPEPAVAVYYGAACVGRMVGRHASGLAQAIAAANAAGYGVLMRAKRTQPDRVGIGVAMGSHAGPTDSMLDVRSTLDADLYYWLQLPPEQRAAGFFELDWVKTVYQDYYQLIRREVLGDQT